MTANPHVVQFRLKPTRRSAIKRRKPRLNRQRQMMSQHSPMRRQSIYLTSCNKITVSSPIRRSYQPRSGVTKVGRTSTRYWVFNQRVICMFAVPLRAKQRAASKPMKMTLSRC